MSAKPWIDYIVRSQPETPELSRDEFKAKFFPQYVQDWKPNYDIRLNKSGRPVRMPNKSDFQTQQTKRDNIVDAGFEEYLNCFRSVPA